jgi:methylaspartate mutase epsilon subunit
MFAKLSDLDFHERRLALRQHPLLREFPANMSAKIFSEISLARLAACAYQQRRNIPYIQPRGGFSLWEQQRSLTVALAEAGADFIPLTVDSHTRQNDHDRASLLLKQSEESGENLLNGYPLLAHGAIATRALYENIERPVSLRHGTPDARLLVEAALDSGISEIEGGGLCYCLPYSRAYPIDRALLNWQYVDRLCAMLSTKDRPIHRESFGPLTATMVPPVMVVIIEILELLLAAEQGVISFAFSFSQTGSMIQDLATARVLRSEANRVLEAFGFKDVVTRLVFHQWMGAFPHDRIYAEALIVQGAMIAALCDADKVVVKTRTEALGIPDIQSNTDAVRISRYAMSLCNGSNFSDEEVLQESDAIQKAAAHVIDSVLYGGNGPLWERVASSVRSGIIDVPFSPHQENVSKLWTLRDSKRGIRVADPGSVPLSEAFLKREHRMLGRRLADGSLDRMLEDILIMVNGIRE